MTILLGVGFGAVAAGINAHNDDGELNEVGVVTIVLFVIAIIYYILTFSVFNSYRKTIHGSQTNMV